MKPISSGRRCTTTGIPVRVLSDPGAESSLQSTSDTSYVPRSIILLFILVGLSLHLAVIGRAVLVMHSHCPPTGSPTDIHILRVVNQHPTVGFLLGESVQSYISLMDLSR